MKSRTTNCLVFYALFFLIQIQRLNAQSTPLSINKKDFTKPKYDPNKAKDMEIQTTIKQPYIHTDSVAMTPKGLMKATLLLNEQPIETPKKIKEQLFFSITKQSQF